MAVESMKPKGVVPPCVDPRRVSREGVVPGAESKNANSSKSERFDPVAFVAAESREKKAFG